MKVSLRSAVFFVLCTAILCSTVTYLFADRAIFAGRCSINGNNPLVCWCTLTALPELPPAYREAAISWSHQSSGEYAQTIMAAAAWRALEHATDIDKQTVASLRNTKMEEWLSTAVKKTGWHAAKKSIKKAVSKAALPLAIGSVVYFEGKDLAIANSAMKRACGTQPHFLYRSAQMQQALEETAQSTWQRTKELSNKTIETTREASAGVWDWVKDQSRRVWPW